MSAKNASPRSTKKIFTLAAILVAGSGISAFAYGALPSLFPISYSEPLSAALVTESSEASTTPALPPVLHLPTPTPLKAIYMSQCAVGTPSLRNSLVEFVEKSELNSIVIDIKDYTGRISFPTQNTLVAHAVSPSCGARDMQEFIKLLHEKNIYVIGRITVFQDPYYASLYPELAVQSTNGGVWRDHKGLAFIDVGARDFWKYIVELGRESYRVGFDELNFDYIRYPSDGPMSETLFVHSQGRSKPEVLEEFFKYLADELRPTGAILSADLFGMTATVESDMGIGQVLERALPYFDYIYPMVYPSHYPSGFQGFANVNEHGYEIVKYAMDTAVARTAATSTRIGSFAYTPIASTSPQRYLKPSYSSSKIRPWLQSFDYPVPYTPAMVSDQIRATLDAGLDSWLFWDAANQYTALRAALLRE